MNKNYKKNFIWNMIGLTMYCFISFLLLIFVKRINGSNNAGIFSYAFSLCTLFFYVAMFYNRTYQISCKQYDFNSFFTTRLITCFISFVVILSFSVISHFTLYKISIILLLMLFRIIDAISDCFYAELQSKDYLYKVGISYSLKSIFGITGFLLIDLLFHNMIYSIIGLIATNLLILLIYDVRSILLFNKNIVIKLNFSNLKEIVLQTFSVFIFSFLSVYLSNAQKYVITYLSDDYIQMIFGILIMPATIISLVGNYLIHPFLTKLVFYKDNKKWSSYNKLVLLILGVLLLIGVVVVLGTYFVGIYILNMIYNITLYEYKLDLIIVILASIFIASSMIISGVLTIINKNIIQVVIYGITSIIATFTCIILTRFGVIRGAVVSYLLASFMTALLFFISYMYNIISLMRKNNYLKEKK